MDCFTSAVMPPLAGTIHLKPDSSIRPDSEGIQSNRHKWQSLWKN